ncbi:MAG: alpha/beta hydrolase [Planktomarina sp.]|uniref:alpha/beta hydrolase n=1 Tax=Planktomarina sp. TaxID=2024851 RepID=UPI003260DA15|nr:alpha/beta hydrolase [Planktomarina sp.]
MLSPAPLRNDLARGPGEGSGHWVQTPDGLRLRLGVWRSGTKGTVLIFPGRTEYIEKYGGAAAALAKAGYSCLAIDWRGQGLSDRLLPDRLIGHVHKFSDYQRDVQTLMSAAKSMDLPEPYFLIAHSMGGCIGLRALMQGLPVQAVSFSAPMWGILFHPPAKRALAWALSSLLYPFKLAEMRAPGSSIGPYLLEVAFEDNQLSCDPQMFEMMQYHLQELPDCALGGPSLHWLNEALHEMLALHRRRAPNAPALCFVGGLETIVDPRRIQQRMAHWPGARLKVVPQAKHEFMMERPEIRAAFYRETIAHFDRHHPSA